MNFLNSVTDSSASTDVTAEKDDHAIIEEDSGLTLDASHLKSDDLASESGFFTESSQVVRTPKDEPPVSSDSERSSLSDSEEIRIKELETNVSSAEAPAEERPENKKVYKTIILTLARKITN